MTEDLDAELRGRVIALETIVIAMVAHMAAHTSNPTGFTAQVMDNADQMLNRFAATAPKEMERTSLFALESFSALSNDLLAHLNRYAVPKGRS
ncbi:hypothetical protein J2X65_001675 [Ancylobacter sp. 3268]|uniref:hypothetical protein n=1 Tax=Ancylobacter sp. 3268 TaxID=2817752 RepID=UPI0028562535|nr:hypothetical protein [Ancylobacter sp. 3268]MDR6952320.1 hypothetical protein [Ancylobacter sp. 3268]